MKRDPRCTLLPLAALSLMARPQTYEIHIGSDDYGPELLSGRDADARREVKRPVEISPLTGKQPLANPTSKRRAALLEKALRRQTRSTHPTGADQ